MYLRSTIANRVAALDGRSGTVTAGFLGIVPVQEYVRQGPLDVLALMGDMAARTLEAFATLPQKMAGIWDASFRGAERAPDSPVGVVGASRIGGEVLAADVRAVGFAGTPTAVVDRIGSYRELGITRPPDDEGAGPSAPGGRRASR